MTTLEQKFVDIALSYIGSPYIWGGKEDFLWTPTGMVVNPFRQKIFDCSGLVTVALWHATDKKVDYRGTHSAKTILESFPSATDTELDGVLLLYPAHVSISLGKGRVVDAHGGDRSTITLADAERRKAKVEAHRINRPRSSLLGIRRIPH